VVFCNMKKHMYICVAGDDGGVTPLSINPK
jgi:hypothetical protein